MRILLFLFPILSFGQLTHDIPKCSDAQKLSFHTNGSLDYAWTYGAYHTDGNFGSFPLDSGVNNLTLTATYPTGCAISSVVKIRAEECTSIWFPLAFCPDGVNQIWWPKHEGVTIKMITIFDRWGHEVFRDNVSGWSGKNCTGTVFSYMAEYYQGKVFKIKYGKILLIR